MPTYEYACRECGEHLEVVQSFKDDALTDCPACDTADALRKVFSAAGIIFKGSGWHIKDYSAAKSPTTGSASGSEGSGSGSSSSGSSSDGGSSDSSSTGSSTSSDSGGGSTSEAKSA